MTQFVVELTTFWGDFGKCPMIIRVSIGTDPGWDRPRHGYADVSSDSRQLEAVDLLIEKAIVVTMDPRRTVIHDGALAITKDRIVAVGKTADLKARYLERRRLMPVALSSRPA
jgi:hypothetical protein